MGRRSKLTPEVQARICEAIAVGATYEHAAAAGGVDYRTLLRWRDAKSQFCQAVKDAEARGVLALLDRIQDAAAAGTWQAAAWILERRYPRDYGRTVQNVELSGPDGQELRLSLGVVDRILAEADGRVPAD